MAAIPSDAGTHGVLDRAEGEDGFYAAWRIAVEEGAHVGVRAYGEGAGNRTSAYAWTAHLAPTDAPDQTLWAAARTVAFSSTDTRVQLHADEHPDVTVHTQPQTPVHVPFLTRPEGLGLSASWVAEEATELTYVVLGAGDGWWHGEFDVLGGPGVEIVAKTTGPATLATEAELADDGGHVVDGPFNAVRYRAIEGGGAARTVEGEMWAQYVVIGDAHDDGLEIDYQGPNSAGTGARAYDLWGEAPGQYTFGLAWPAVASSERSCLLEQGVRATTGVVVPYHTCADWTAVLLTADVERP